MSLGDAGQDEEFDRMHERGYFRDPYNNNDFLWKFGLSWWDDLIPMLDTDGDLSPAQASQLLDMLDGNQMQFRESLRKMSQEERRYFLDRYADLQKFLNEAIERGAPIHASLGGRPKAGKPKTASLPFFLIVKGTVRQAGKDRSRVDHPRAVYIIACGGQGRRVMYQFDDLQRRGYDSHTE